MANFGNITQGNSGDLQSNVILQESLDTFNSNLGFLKSIHRDFGGQAMRFNQELITRIWSVRAAGDVGDFAQATGYNNGGEDSDGNPVAIKLDQHPFIKFHLTDLEREQSEVDLVSEPAKQAAHALSKKVADTLVTEGLSNADTIAAVSKANFGVDDLFAIAEDMDEEDFPAEGRWVVLSPQAYYALLNSLQGYSNATYNVGPGLTEANLDTRLAGFQVYTYSQMAVVSDGTASGWDVLAGYRGSLAMVNRLPEFADASMQVGDIANASEPTSGLSLQLRRKYDVMDAKEKYALTLMYGVKAPNDGTDNRLFKQKVT